MSFTPRIHSIFSALGILPAHEGIDVHCPLTSEKLFTIGVTQDDEIATLCRMAASAQARWAHTPYSTREQFMLAFADYLAPFRGELAELIHAEMGKAMTEANGECDNAIQTLRKTCSDAAAFEQTHTAPAMGVVGLITSFNFPLSVAHWTLAPALLAGNAVVWKPSERTPLCALAWHQYWKQFCAAQTLIPDFDPAPLVCLVLGDKTQASLMVSHPQICMLSATGSVAMGQALETLIEQKKTTHFAPIFELGGNNATILSPALSPEKRHEAISAVLACTLGTTGQRCTNTRRLLVPRPQMDEVVGLLCRAHQALEASWPQGNNAYGYTALISAQAAAQYQQMLDAAQAANVHIFLGGKESQPLHLNVPGNFVRPTLAVCEASLPTDLLAREIFAPLLWVYPFDTLEEAFALANAPDNAGLVHALYTPHLAEAHAFAQLCEAGHAVINSPTGTNVPAQGLGFGGNKESGTGIILAPNPLASFVQGTHTPLGNTPTSAQSSPDATGKIRYVLHKTIRGVHTSTRVVIHAI